MERLGGYHRALHIIRRKRFLDSRDDFRLPIRADHFRWNDIGIVSGPIPDPDFTEFGDNCVKADLRSCGRVKKSVAGISRSPLRARYEILAPRLWAVRASARLHKAGHQFLLFIGHPLEDTFRMRRVAWLPSAHT